MLTDIHFVLLYNFLARSVLCKKKRDAEAPLYFISFYRNPMGSKYFRNAAGVMRFLKTRIKCVALENPHR